MAQSSRDLIKITLYSETYEHSSMQINNDERENMFVQGMRAK